MKFLFVSLDGLIGDIAWQVVKEGHEVRYFIRTPRRRRRSPTASCRRPTDWQHDVDWADVIVFDDVLGQGAGGAGAARGGQAGGRRLALHRPARGRPRLRPEELKAAGVAIIPQENFTSFDDAIAYVKANPNRYVIKPSGEAQNIKRLLFVGEEEDGKDVIQVLEDYKRAWSNKHQGVPAPAAHHRRRGGDRRVLQRQGVRRRRSASTSSTRSCFPATSARPPARWAPRCSGASPTSIFNATLKKMEPRLREEGYVGYIDVNCIVNSNGIYPLEFTARFGYPDDQHPAGRPAHADRRVALQARRGHADALQGAQRLPGRRAHRGAAVPVQRPEDLREHLEGRGDPLQEARAARASTSRT